MVSCPLSKKHFGLKIRGGPGTLGPLSWIRHCSQPCRVALLVTPSNYVHRWEVVWHLH